VIQVEPPWVSSNTSAPERAQAAEFFSNAPFVRDSKYALVPLTAATIASATSHVSRSGLDNGGAGFSNPLRSALDDRKRDSILNAPSRVCTPHFAQTFAPTPTVTWLSRMRGVLPTASRTLDKILDIGFSPKSNYAARYPRSSIFVPPSLQVRADSNVSPPNSAAALTSIPHTTERPALKSRKCSESTAAGP